MVLLELKGVACGSFRVEIVRSETPLQSRLEEDVFAEVAATNMAIVKAMGLLASSEAATRRISPEGQGALR